MLRVDAAFQPSIDPLLNQHHLELFYYVAKHGGISAASRAIPYGLGQPAISGQMADLERQLNTRLFDRRPFHLHRAGQTLFDYIEKHFDGLPLLEEKLTARPKHTCRIALDDLLGPHLLPALMTASNTFSAEVVWEFPAVPPGEPANLLRERLAHLVITTAEGHCPGVRSLVLGRVAPCLLVSRDSAITSSADFWRRKKITERLIYSSGAPTLRHSFERGLQGLRANWPASIQTASHTNMRALVAGGLGVGLSLALPSVIRHPGVRHLPLPGFDPVPVVALWSGPSRPWHETLLTALRKSARALWGEADGNPFNPETQCGTERTEANRRNTEG